MITDPCVHGVELADQECWNTQVSQHGHFTLAADANGDVYASFGFQVSVSALLSGIYTMRIDASAMAPLIA